MSVGGNRDLSMWQIIVTIALFTGEVRAARIATPGALWDEAGMRALPRRARNRGGYGRDDLRPAVRGCGWCGFSKDRMRARIDDPCRLSMLAAS